jgi:hypothetical protein
MTDDQEKAFKKDLMERLEKTKGRLQQSFPEIQQLIKTSNAVEVARKIIDPAQSIFKQFADDIQLKDLFAKAEALVAKASLTVTKTVSRDAPPTETFLSETPANKLPSRKASLKKAPSKGVRLKKPLKKKAPSKKTRPPLKRRMKASSWLTRSKSPRDWTYFGRLSNN